MILAEEARRPRVQLPNSLARKTRRRLLVSKLIAAGLLGLVLVSHDIYAENSAWELILESAAFLLLLTGAMGRIWAGAYIAGKKSQVLVREGPYSIVRNPLYFFSLLAALGAGLAFDSLSIALLMGGGLLLTHWQAILEEERWLQVTFGAAFESYRETVPRFVPKPKLLSPGGLIEFDPLRFSHHLLESSLILLAFPLARLVEWCHQSSLLPCLLRLP